MKAESFPIPKPCTVSLREDRSAVLSGNKGESLTYPYVLYARKKAPSLRRFTYALRCLSYSVQYFLYGRRAPFIKRIRIYL